MRHIIITCKTKEDESQLLSFIKDDPGYKYIRSYERGEWKWSRPPQRPHSASIIGCATPEKEFALRLRFENLKKSLTP